MSTMPSETDKTEKNTIQELITMVLHQANEISYDLYYFKMKSRGIQMKIQNDINSFNLYADKSVLRGLDEMRLKKEDSFEKMLKALSDWNLELKKVAAVIAELRILSNPEDPSPITEPSPKQTCNKLRALNNALYYKNLHMKWFSAWLKTQLAHKRLQQEATVNLLNMCLQNEDLFKTLSPTYKHGSSSKLTPSLSDMISDINKMIGNLSFKSADEVSASKPSIFDEKQPPTFESGSTDIHSETKPQITSPPKVYIFGVKPNTSEQTQAPQEFSIKCQPRIFTSAKRKGASKPQKKHLPKNPITNDFEAKTTNTKSGSSNNDLASQEPLKFKLPTFKTFKSKHATIINNDTGKPEPPSNGNIYIFGAETTTSEPDQASHESLKIEPPIFESANVKNDTKPQINKKSKEPRNPPTKPFEAKSTSAPMAAKNVDFTDSAQASNESASYLPRRPRKLRTFKYKSANVNNEASKPQNGPPYCNPRDNLAGGEPMTADSTAPVRFSPPTGTDVIDNTKVRYQYITSIKEFENKSLEELRFEDYIAGRKGPSLYVFESRLKNNATFPRRRPIRFSVTPAQNRETPTQNYDTTTKNQENLKQNCATSTQHLDTPTQYFDTPKQNGEIPTQSFDSPTQNRETPTCHFNTSTHEFDTPTQNRETPIPHFDTSTQNVENPTQHFDISTQHREKTTQHFDTSTQYREIPTRHFNTSTREFDTPTQNRETSAQKFDSPTQNQETPTQHFDTSTQNKEKTTQNRENTTQHFDTSTQNREKTTQNRESPTQFFDSQTQNRESPTQNRETPTQFYDCQTQNRESPTQFFDSQTQNPETSTPDLEPSVSDENAAAAEGLLEAGKAEKAFTVSSDALGTEAYFLVLRARAYYDLKKYQEALEDLQKAVGILPILPANVSIDIAKCCLRLGQIASGEQAIRHAIERNLVQKTVTSPEVEKLREAFVSLRSQQESAHRFMSEHKYFDAVYYIDDCLKNYCPACSMMKLLKAECLAHMEKFNEARCIAIDTSLLSTNTCSGAVYADAMYVVGLCSYYQEHDEMAIKKFRKVLEHDPDHEKAIKMIKLTKTRKNTKLIMQKKEEGNKAFKAGVWTRALKLYNEALSVDKNNKQENAKLHYNRATVFAKQNQLSNAIHACTAALQLDENYVKPLLRRAQCYTEIRMYEKALEDYEKLYYIDSTDEYKLLLQEANERQMANKGPYYYYKILGINKFATLDEIKKAYKKCAMRYHPDRHACASLGELRTNERKFKQAKEAYDTLGETRSRANYDRTERRYDYNTESEDE